MNNGQMKISLELLRAMLDLPDSISLTGARLSLDGQAGPTLDLEVSSEFDMRSQITPLYSQKRDGDVVKVKLEAVHGFDGPLTPRPSLREDTPR